VPHSSAKKNQMSSCQSITILGATGSIGSSTLKVIAFHPERYSVYAISGFYQLDNLAALAQKVQPNIIVVTNTHDSFALSILLP